MFGFGGMAQLPNTAAQDGFESAALEDWDGLGVNKNTDVSTGRKSYEDKLLMMVLDSDRDSTRSGDTHTDWDLHTNTLYLLWINICVK